MYGVPMVVEPCHLFAAWCECVVGDIENGMCLRTKGMVLDLSMDVTSTEWARWIGIDPEEIEQGSVDC